MTQRERTTTAAWGLIAVLWAPAAGAGEPLSLGEAMSAARERAHQVLAAAARAEAGRQTLREARAHARPRLRLSEIWTRTDSPAEAFGLLLNQERFSLAEFAAGDPNDPATIENALTRLEIELPLWTGGELSGRIRQAELGAGADGLAADRIADEAARAAAEAYLGLLAVEERVRLLERTLETVEAHAELAAAYVEQGLAVRSERLRAEVERARVADLVVEARGQARLAAAELAFRMGLEGPREWSVSAPSAPPVGPGADLGPLESWLQTAEDRADLAAARRRLEAGRLEERVRRSGRLPKVGLLARHDRYDDTLFGGDGASSAIVAVATIDLFAGGRHRAAAARAGAEAEAAAHDVERFREAIRLEIRDAWLRAATARERRATAAAALEAAREGERIVRERFEHGVAKTLDVLDALTARREAEARELFARTEAQLAAVRLAVAAGRPPETALATPAANDDERNER